MSQGDKCCDPVCFILLVKDFLLVKDLIDFHKARWYIEFVWSSKVSIQSTDVSSTKVISSDMVHPNIYRLRCISEGLVWLVRLNSIQLEPLTRRASSRCSLHSLCMPHLHNPGQVHLVRLQAQQLSIELAFYWSFSLINCTGGRCVIGPYWSWMRKCLERKTKSWWIFKRFLHFLTSISTEKSLSPELMENRRK